MPMNRVKTAGKKAAQHASDAMNVAMHNALQTRETDVLSH